MNNEFKPGTVHPENDYLEIARLGAKLGIPVPMMHITLEAKDADGNVTGRHHDRSRTFNRNFWNRMFAATANASVTSGTFGVGSLNMRSLAAATFTQNNSISNFGNQFSHSSPFDYGTSRAIVGEAGFGIVVGTGTGAEAFDGITLGTRTINGTSAGTLSYNAQAAPTISYAALVWTAAHLRIFNNNSGGSIIIAETGLYAQISGPDAGLGAQTVNPSMIERSLLASAVTVANGGQLSVTYTMTMTFPA